MYIEARRILTKMYPAQEKEFTLRQCIVRVEKTEPRAALQILFSHGYKVRYVRQEKYEQC